MAPKRIQVKKNPILRGQMRHYMQFSTLGATLLDVSSHHATYNEVQCLQSALSPQHHVLAPIHDKPNQWCVNGNYQIYRDEKILNYKMVMTWLMTVEWRVLTWSLQIVLEVHNLFTHHRILWMACIPKSYSYVVVREFYAISVETRKCS